MICRYRVGPRRVAIAVSIPITDSSGAERQVVIADPAVDQGKSDLAKYSASIWDASHLAFEAGQEPTWWTIQPLTRRQKDAAQGMAPRERAAFFIRCSVSTVENYTIKEADGSEVSMPQPARRTSGQLGDLAPESWIDQLDLPEEYLHALAFMIKAVSEAGDPLASK